MHKNILIVDDDDSINSLFMLYARKYSLNCVVAKDGVDGLSRFYNQDFSLIITDIEMPKMNGIEFVKRVRNSEKNNRVPFLIMSSSLNDFGPEIAILDKVYTLEKPLNPKVINQIFAAKYGAAKEKEKLDVNVIKKRFEDEVVIKISQIYQIIMKESPKLEKKIDQSELLNLEKCSFCIGNVGLPKMSYVVIMSFSFEFVKNLIKILGKKEGASGSSFGLEMALLKKLNLTLLSKVRVGMSSAQIDMKHIPIGIHIDQEDRSTWHSVYDGPIKKFMFKGEKGNINFMIIPASGKAKSL